MEVILNSEIARLVLGYLKEQSLDKAHRKFCQTSKYLKDEYELLRRGYQPISVSNSSLVEIIKEYCELKSKINQFINLFPNEILGNIQSQSSLIKRLEFILSKAKSEILREGDNTFKEHNSTKRKRSHNTTSSTSDTECTDIDNNHVNPYYRKNKMFKLHSPNIGYTILSSKDKKRNITPRSGIKADTHPISPTADLTALKETLLENTEFQNKLADNINKIMNSSAGVDKTDDFQNSNKDNKNQDQIQFAMTNAIDNIISTFEQDPIFDHIVQDVVNHQSILYDEELGVIDNEQLEYNTNHSDRGLSRTSTPKKDGGINNSVVVDVTAADVMQPNINDKELEIIPNRNDTVKNAFVISNEPFHAELFPNLQNLTSNTSHLIITPKSMATQTQQQNNQSNLIFINEPTFNSALPMINLNNTSSNQFPFLMSSSMLNEPNVSLPFVMNSSPCVPISTSQFPVNFIAQQQSIPSISVPVRRGRPRKIMAPIQQQTAVTSTQTHQYQMNKPPIMEIISNSIITKSVVNTNSVSMVPSTSNVSTIVTSSQNTASSSVIYSQAALNIENQNILNENKLITDVQSNVIVNPTIVGSKIQNQVENPEVFGSDAPNNNEFIIIDVTDTAPKQSNSVVIKELETISPQTELKPIQVETNKIVSSNEQEHSATPKQNMKPIENLKVKSNSTPRRRSHVRILDFTTPGRSETIPQMPRTIERSIHLKSDWKKISRFNKFKPKDKIEKQNETTRDDITATPKVRKNSSKCVRVLSRSASEEQYEKENGNTDSNNEIKNVDNITSDSITKVGNVKLAVNLSPMDEWKQLRNISQTKNWDSYLRFVSAAENTKIKKSEEVAKRKLLKLKLMKERKKSKLTAKRLKKPVRKSPRLQKKRKGKILEKSKKLKHAVEESKDEKNVEIATVRVESDVVLMKEEITKNLEDVTESIVVVKEDVSPVVATSNNELQVPVIHPPHSMASLLETPFKSDAFQANPITPRFLPPLAIEDTPITKILKSLNKHLGSELKNDIFTPNFAITPGCNLTPPKALDIMTPQSGPYNRPTDYSSGSSYYRPDESDDKIESLASASRNKSVNEFEYETILTKNTQIGSEQTIVVQCPGVLEKVKSCSENSNPIPENIVPHYTFNVPDEVETKETDTSNSSSCSCSSSSSSSSSSSDSSNTSYHPKIESESTVNTIINENGEIRYPIRTWLTPKKVEMIEVSPHNNKPLQSAILSDKQTVLRDLEEKRIRMRDKIKISETSGSKYKRSKQPIGNFKSQKNVNPRQSAKQPLVSSKPSCSSSSKLCVDKLKPPRKNPTPKKLIPLKTHKSEPTAMPTNSKSFKEDVNDLIAVLSDDLGKVRKQSLKTSDKVTIKSEDRELAEEFKDAYQNALSDSDDEDDDECELVLQTEVLNFVYDEKLSCQPNENQQNEFKDFLLSSKSIMNVNYNDRKIQIKASDLINFYDYAPRKHNIHKKPNISRLKNVECEKSKLKSSDPNHKIKPKEKYASQTPKLVRNDKKVINQLHKNMPKDKKFKNLEPLVIPESPESRNTSTNQPTNAKAQFNLKYKQPKHHLLPVKKAILSRPLSSASGPTADAVQLNNTAKEELNQPFKIPIKVDMKNKLKPSSSDTINAVLAHLHGTE